MYTSFNMSGNQNQVLDNLPSCNGCRELKRELEELKRIINQIMNGKKDISNVSALLSLTQQRFLLEQQQQQQQHQQIVSESPFVQSLLPNWSNNLMRLISNGGLNQLNSASTARLNFQNQIDNNHIWSPLQQISNSTSNNNGNFDIAQTKNSVDNNVDNNFVDNNGIDSSETSSSRSSVNTQLGISPKNQNDIYENNKNISNLNGTNNKHVLDTVQRAMTSNLFNIGQLASTITNTVPTPSGIVAAVASIASHTNFNPLQQSSLYTHLPLSAVQLPTMVGRPHSAHNSTGGPIGVISEKKKASTDDFVKNIRQCQMSLEDINKIEIPVPEALKYDQNFRPVSEEQIIQQIMTSKKYESMDVLETMIQLCKKLAEKRVFGSRLMADTTVAAPNHSTYTNLPDKGIIYILHVCRKVLGPRVKTEDEFWEYFRDAMRKLAARCRRVRHAKKMKTQQKALPSKDISTSIFASAKALTAEDNNLKILSSVSPTSNQSTFKISDTIESSPSPNSPSSSMATTNTSNSSSTEPVVTGSSLFLKSA